MPTSKPTTRVQRLCYTALMTVIICICSWLAIPLTVPITMQTFAVFCALLLLGGKDGTVSIVLYLLMGIIGLPVFSGFRGGLGHLAGPTGGFAIGFLLIGGVYILMEPLIRKKPALQWVALGIGTVLCYLLGTVWFAKVYAAQGAEFSFLSVLCLCVLPYIIPDGIKLALAVYVSNSLSKRKGAD